MIQTKIKVCGLTQLTQIRELVAMDVDFLGFIFYEKSPRFVLNHLSLKEISEINHSGKVGVFVNETVEKIIEISEKADLNFIQLHGDENEDFIINLREKLNSNIKIIKVIRIGNQKSEVRNEIEKISNLKSQISNLLFDTDSQAFGGTGKTFDWNILNEIEIPIPYFLSGGISLENIGELKKIIKNNPLFALDINSKFETEPGIKVLEKIKEFKSVVKAQSLNNAKETNKIQHQIKQSKELSDKEIELILKYWKVEEWLDLDYEKFKIMFEKSEFHFLKNDEKILSLARINFDFKIKIENNPYNFAEFVGFVSIEKNKGYGSLLLEKIRKNLEERNIETIGFCENYLRTFYEKTKIEILYNKAHFFMEFENNEWIKSTDDDILILNASQKTIQFLQNLNEINKAFLI